MLGFSSKTFNILKSMNHFQNSLLITMTLYIPISHFHLKLTKRERTLSLIFRGKVKIISLSTLYIVHFREKKKNEQSLESQCCSCYIYRGCPSYSAIVKRSWIQITQKYNHLRYSTTYNICSLLVNNLMREASRHSMK